MRKGKRIKTIIICDKKLDLDMIIDGFTELEETDIKLIHSSIKERILERNIKERDNGNGYVFNPDYPGTRTELRFYKLDNTWVSDLAMFDEKGRIYYHKPLNSSKSKFILRKKSYNEFKKTIFNKYTINDNGEIIECVYRVIGSGDLLRPSREINYNVVSPLRSPKKEDKA